MVLRIRRGREKQKQQRHCNNKAHPNPIHNGNHNSSFWVCDYEFSRIQEALQRTGVAAKLRRQQSILAVLRIQETQKKQSVDGMCNPESIAVTYSQCTTHSVECAYLRGLKEQQECYHDDN